jgi:hypothetical protein
MQDDIIKHSKKIFSTVKSKEHNFGVKVKDIVIEVSIIVFALTLSIWLNNWSQHRSQQKEVRVFLTNLKKDLVQDLEALTKAKENYSNITKKYEYITNITPSQLDSLKKTKTNMSIPFFTTAKKTNDGNYEGFKSSGKIGNIENEELKQLIVGYYQQSVPNMNEADKIYLDFVVKIIEYNIENAGQTEKLSYDNPQLRERLKFAIMLGKNIVLNYDENCIEKAKKIIEKIDIELHE